jgi:Peptidase family M28
MPAADTAAQLTEFSRRGAGTNAERRAALWVRGELQSARRSATLETFWCRPNQALTHVWHVALAVAGSLVMVSRPVIGGALVLGALLCVLADWVTGRSPGRRLTLEHASQNVVSRPVRAPATDPPFRLILTANYDAGRTALAHRLRRFAPRAAGPGWLGWLVIGLVWLLAVAVLRHAGGSPSSRAVGILQLVPTVGLVLALALLLEAAVADFGPAAADNAAGTAVAIALARALDAAPPRRLSVELVLQGAGDGQMLGLRRHLRARRRELDRRRTIVLGIGPVAAGRPSWWTADGPLVPLRFHRRLRELAGAVTEAGLTARPHHGRGTSPALPARVAGIPAITVGCLDDRGLAAHSHTAQDTAATLESSAVDELLQFALTLVDAIDADLARQEPGAASGRPAGAPAPAPAHR